MSFCTSRIYRSKISTTILMTLETANSILWLSWQSSGSSLSRQLPSQTKKTRNYTRHWVQRRNNRPSRRPRLLQSQRPKSSSLFPRTFNSFIMLFPKGCRLKIRLTSSDLLLKKRLLKMQTRRRKFFQATKTSLRSPMTMGCAWACTNHGQVCLCWASSVSKEGSGLPSTEDPSGYKRRAKSRQRKKSGKLRNSVESTTKR